MNRSYFISLAFADDNGKIRSITIRNGSSHITAPLIRQAIGELEMNENASLLSVAMLGKMTDDEYAGYSTRKTILPRWLLYGFFLALILSISAWFVLPHFLKSV